MRLLNVRLDDDDARLVRSLRDRGISISDVVRGAIRVEAKRIQVEAPPDADALLAEMRKRYPRPSGPRAERRVKSTDRRQVQDFVRAKLRRRA